MIRIAMLTTDSREHFKEYSNPQPYFGTAPQALLEGLASTPEAEVHVLSCLQQPVSSPEKLAQNIWYHGLQVPKMGWLRTGYLGCIRAVRKRLKAIQPDIVHGQGTERDCAINAVSSGFPNVLTIHGNMRLISKVNKARPFSYEWLSARLETLTVPRSDGIICITHYTRDAIIPLNSRTWVLPNAVDGSFFEITSRPNPLPTILCVGAICHRKNQNFFIRALDELASTRKFQVLFLGGTQPNSAYEAEFLELLKTRPWCIYGGFADRNALKSYFSFASLLALPSLEDNCPMAVLEAMAAGVPVLAARVGGLPDLIEEKKTGLFCDPLDMKSLRHGVAQIFDQPAAMSEMAEAARKRANQNYHPTAIARQHLQIYREVLNGPATAKKQTNQPH